MQIFVDADACPVVGIVEEIAEKCNTINYEIISTISERVPRVFK